MSVFVVAGAAGRVGAVVASDLLSQSRRVRVIVRDAAKSAAFMQRGAEVAVGSLADGAFLASALEGASAFFTLLPEDPAVPDFRDHRRRMADAMAAAVKQTRVPHVVMHSALAACLPERNGPARELHYLEQALGATGARLTANRSCYFQENIASAIAPARHAGIFPSLMPSADIAFPMIATTDVGHFAARALTMPPSSSEVVDLMGPAYSMRQLAEKLGRALGRTLQVVSIPPAGQVAALTQAGLPPAYAEAVAEMFAAFGAGLIVPRGDRMLAGTTTIDDVISRLASMPSPV